MHVNDPFRLVSNAAAELNERRRTRLEPDCLYPYDGGIRFSEGNPIPLGGEESCLDITKEMFDCLYPETGAYISSMLDNGFYDVTLRAGKQSGGYPARSR